MIPRNNTTPPKVKLKLPIFLDVFRKLTRSSLIDA